MTRRSEPDSPDRSATDFRRTDHIPHTRAPFTFARSCRCEGGGPFPLQARQATEHRRTACTRAGNPRFVRRVRAPSLDQLCRHSVTVSSSHPGMTVQASPYCLPGPSDAGPQRHGTAGRCRTSRRRFETTIGLAESALPAHQCAGCACRARKDLRTPASETFSKPIRRTFFVADQKCYMCGSVSRVRRVNNPSRRRRIPRPFSSSAPEKAEGSRSGCSAGGISAATAAAGRSSSMESEMVTRRYEPNTTGSKSARARSRPPNGRSKSAPNPRAPRIPRPRNRTQKTRLGAGRCAAPPSPR